MGSSGYMMKGHGGTSSNSSSRVMKKYSYVLMLMIAFGAAIIGVHKLRERRIFNLLVKEKDRQLFSLQLLLQKERDYAKETKRETDEMKSKLYTLQSQKADLDSSILEMRSTISSLKDEQKAMETALEEKQNELKFLREKETEFNKEQTQLISLSEKLEQKDAEIEDLKNRIGAPVKVWSVSAADPLNPQVNLTLANYNENEIIERGNNSMRIGEQSGNESILGSRKDIEDSIDGGRLDIGKEERKENGTEGILKSGFEVENHGDEVSESKEIGVNYKGGMKLEMAEKTENGGSNKGRGNRVRKGKGKRLRRFVKDALESERKKRVKNGEVQKTEEQNEEQKKDLAVENARSRETSEGRGLESKSAGVSTDQKEGESLEVGEKMSEKVDEKKMEDGMLQKHGETEDGENASKKVEKGKEMAFGEMLRGLELSSNRTVDGEGKKKLGEVGSKDDKVVDEETEELDVEIQESDKDEKEETEEPDF